MCPQAEKPKTAVFSLENPLKSGVAPANQTKEKVGSWTFRRGIPEQKFDMWMVLGFPRKNIRIHKKMGEIHMNFSRFGPFFGLVFREIPPGLLQHVLTVLVFWSWVLLLSWLPPWSRSLRWFPWASILLYRPLEIAWICCLQLPHHPCKNGTHSTCFTARGGGGHTPRNELPQESGR